jgi:hypothetical protein
MTIIREFLWTGFVALSAIVCIFAMTFGHGALTKAKAARLKSSSVERVQTDWTLRASR